MTSEWILEKSKDGLNILKVTKNNKNIYIGSKYNQKREIDKFLMEIEYFNNDIYIIFGLADGGYIRELIKKKKSKNRILIIEYNEDLMLNFFKVEKEIDFNEIFITSDFIKIKNFLESIKSHLVDNIKIHHYLNYSKVYNSEVKATFDFMKEIVGRIIVNRNTSLRFGEEWFKTLLQNIKNGKNAIELNHYKEKFSDVPAIIVSAGPSLSNNIDYLKGFDKGLIISGGRTLRALQEKDIEADLLCIIDSGETSYELVKNRISQINIPLVFNENTNCKIVEEHKGPKVIFSGNKIVDDIWGVELPRLVSGGSVAHSMTSLAIYLGCNPIIFIGQDLAYTNEKNHAEIAYNESDLEGELERIKNIKKSDAVYTEDINGELIRTNKVFQAFKLSFEELIERNSEIKFINATEGGANIKGAENRKLVDVISEFREIDIKGNIKRKVDIKQASKEIGIVLKGILKKIDDCNELCNESILELKRMKIKYIKKIDIEKNLERLDLLDLKMKKNIREISLLDNLTYEEIYKLEREEKYLLKADESKQIQFTKIYEKNLKIYSIIKENLACVKTEVEKTLIDENTNQNINNS
ncbi:6-hydroxymethylpterin diphosphokinase MptE-like protein [uncultured Clostridium sp.]|jgi:hypothetical protein|uniref:motility associated factor glycosyltransferase family protein n=1 Tax=uncultured Clostridium sp. TaxID=59620 RepID=UPI0026056726|nr:6-hydroxymethylpterin diphosphokinase MptE-like protein [uncultured Clostridium sp.]